MMEVGDHIIAVSSHFIESAVRFLYSLDDLFTLVGL